MLTGGRMEAEIGTGSTKITELGAIEENEGRKQIFVTSVAQIPTFFKCLNLFWVNQRFNLIRSIHWPKLNNLISYLFPII
jgi:hypothetical protein